MRITKTVKQPKTCVRNRQNFIGITALKDYYIYVNYIRSSSILNPFLGTEERDFFAEEKSISRSESEDESDSESDSGAEEQLRVRFSVKLSRSLGFTLEWQVLRWHLKEDGEV